MSSDRRYWHSLASHYVASQALTVNAPGHLVVPRPLHLSPFSGWEQELVYAGKRFHDGWHCQLPGAIPPPFYKVRLLNWMVRSLDVDEGLAPSASQAVPKKVRVS